MDSRWQQLQNLKDLFDRGFMSQEEYELRKKQLVDDLTGTTVSSEKSSSAQGAVKSAANSSDIAIPIPHGPPNWDDIAPERAIKFEFDWKNKTWRESICTVKLDSIPFSRGALRLVYYLFVGIVSCALSNFDSTGCGKERRHGREKVIGSRQFKESIFPRCRNASMCKILRYTFQQV
jgi:hypothetical protein